MAHTAASKAVDPQLLASANPLEPGPRTATGFTLGPYRFERTSLVREPAPHPPTGGPNGSLGLPAESLYLSLEMDGAQARWSGHCDARREPPEQPDFAAVVDESRDWVRVECRFVERGGEPWDFTMQGSLAANLGGVLRPESAESGGVQVEVEVLMWRSFGRVWRHLPHAVGQTRLAQEATAAMVLARPERAWVASRARPAIAQVSMLTLAALRMLPLGFEG